MIRLLSKDTIDKIAAGEVIDRPESVVRELIDNAIDSGADKISLEIRGGGIQLIRITDNGCGIPKGEIETAFLRHATSKLRSVEDLSSIRSLGFRGEALASICAVSKTELITKVQGELTGTRYQIEAGVGGGLMDIGAPEGTTIIVRDLFYNVPARRSFLRTAATEASYVADTVQKAALSHPDIAFTYIADGRTVFHTLGGGRLLEVIYMLYGRDISSSLLPVSRNFEDCGIRISGYIGRPVISRNRRDMEVYFVNGRHISSDVIRKAIEDGYEGYMMLHRFPFTMLYVDIDPWRLDVNVHPKKMEVRFSDDDAVYSCLSRAIKEALSEAELIVDAGLDMHKAGADKEQKESKEHREEQEPSEKQEHIEEQEHGADQELRPDREFMADQELRADRELRAEPFETKRSELFYQQERDRLKKETEGTSFPGFMESDRNSRFSFMETETPLQQELPREVFLSKSALPQFQLIGQVFGTYWIIEYKDAMYLIDQHAAHEKVNYERLIKHFAERDIASQLIYPPILLSLSLSEAELVEKNLQVFSDLGFEIEHAGDRDFVVRAVPSDLPELSKKELLMEIIDSLIDGYERLKPETLRDKLASMSCKAAVKGNTQLSGEEMKALIAELLSLDNPYACPHGRPTIAKWTRYELDKIFKRVV